MAKLTDRKKSLAGAELTDFLHIVKTGDTSQNSAGSSYKAEMNDYSDLFNYWDRSSGNVSLVPKNTNSVASGNFSIAHGSGNTASGLASFVHGIGSTVSGNHSIVLGVNIIGTQSDTTYVDNFNIKTVPVGTTINNLGIDANGNVVVGTDEDLFVSGLTFNQSNYDLTINRNDGTNFTQSLSILASDMNVTGGTFNPSTGVATFVNNSGGTFDVSGFLVQDNYQKIITTSYTLINGDNNYTILINNGANPITITVPSGLLDKFQVGFIQQGTGDVTFVTSGTTILTPIAGGFKIKGQNYNAYLEQVGVSNVLHLLGNLKV